MTLANLARLDNQCAMNGAINPRGKYGLVDPEPTGSGLPCHYCERLMVAYSPTHPTRDHVIPASRGGRLTVWCCYQCNQIKGDMLPVEWAEYMLAYPSWWETRPIKPHQHTQKNTPPTMGHYRQASGFNEWPWLNKLMRPLVRQVGFGPW